MAEMAEPRSTDEYPGWSEEEDHTYVYSGDNELEYSSDADYEAGGLLGKHHRTRGRRTWRQSRGAEVIRRICGSMVGVVFTVMVLL